MVEQSGQRVPVTWPDRDRVEDQDTPFKIKVHFEGPDVEAAHVYALYLRR